MSGAELTPNEKLVLRREATARVRQLRPCPWCSAQPGNFCSESLNGRAQSLYDTVHVGRMPTGIAPEEWMALTDDEAASHA